MTKQVLTSVIAAALTGAIGVITALGRVIDNLDINSAHLPSILIFW